MSAVAATDIFTVQCCLSESTASSFLPGNYLCKNHTKLHVSKITLLTKKERDFTPCPRSESTSYPATPPFREQWAVTANSIPCQKEKPFLLTFQLICRSHNHLICAEYLPQQTTNKQKRFPYHSRAFLGDEN